MTAHEHTYYMTNMDLRFASLAFFLFSSIEFFSYNLILSAGQDILAGTHAPTSLVLFISVVPIAAVVLIVNYFVQEIPYGVRIVFGVLMAIAGFVLVAYAGDVKWKLTGVGFVSFSMGVIEISFLGLMSHFELTVLSTYATGTGFGVFIAPLYYIAMTTWLCVSPEITIVLVVPLLLLYLLSYYIINKSMEHDRNSQQVYSEDGVAYSKLDSSDTEDSQDRSRGNRKEMKALNKKITTAKEGLSWKEKFRVVGKIIYVVALPGFITFTSEYLLIQSVMTTIAYKNAPFRPRDHYQYYILIFMFGELIGRSHRSVLSFIKPCWLYHPTPALLWLFSVLEMLHLFFFIFESWYRFLPNVTLILVLCITAGIILGMMFNNLVEVLHASFEGKEREFAMGLTLGPAYLGVVMAALIGLYVEPRLYEHCISTVSNSAYCITRSTSLADITARCAMKNINSSIY